jgi:hypothetical protein
MVGGQVGAWLDMLTGAVEPLPRAAVDSSVGKRELSYLDRFLCPTR